MCASYRTFNLTQVGFGLPSKLYVVGLDGVLVANCKLKLNTAAVASGRLYNIRSSRFRTLASRGFAVKLLRTGAWLSW